jgi:signal transduction histidine kinase
VAVVLIGNGALDVWFSYKEAKQALVGIQQEKAESASQRIAAFIAEIERQIGWTTHAQWSAGSVDQRRFDYVRLMRQVPAIMELVQLDSDGREQLKISRVSMDVVGGGTDNSHEPQFAEAIAHNVWFSPVYFRKESEPYMTIAIAHVGKKPGVTVADVNLKLIWDVVSDIKVGKNGYAYVVGPDGRLIAHPDISLVLRNTDLSSLPQVASALADRGATGPTADSVSIAPNYAGTSVLTAHAAIPALNWRVFVELPASEAMEPLYALLTRSGILLGLALLLAAVAGGLLARRMVIPIQQLQLGAERLGGGELGHRIELKTGDEIEVLANRFNRMGEQLQESYATLEAKVEARTQELTEALEQQTATAEVLQVINSSAGDLTPVFDAILQKAHSLCDIAYGSLQLYTDGRFHAVAVHGISEAFADRLRQGYTPGPNMPSQRLLGGDRFAQVSDIAEIDDPMAQAAAELGDIRTTLFIPLRKDARMLGQIVAARKEVRIFLEKEIEILESFATQAVIAIENARLLVELRERSAELARSVEELTTLQEVGQAVSSTLDLATVLATIVTRAVGLAGADAGAIYRYRKDDRQFELDESFGFDEAFAAKIRGVQIREAETTGLAPAIRARTPVQLADLAAAPALPLRSLMVAAGYCSALIVPLVASDQVFGVLTIQKKTVGEFPAGTVRLMQTFASQSVLAIQNAGLFREVEEQGRALAIASQHKSQFLANMSHELRTPLNAVLGYTELLVDGIYGDLPEKARSVLERILSNGKHLLGLINDVLDLSKIEAGQLALNIEDYAMPAVVHSVVSATEALAKAKGLSFAVSVPRVLPPGRGDERRLTQVLLNLLGNAIKFTDKGSVGIEVALSNDWFDVAISDTGPGIAKADQARIFDEFQQVDDSSTRQKGGSGLGLAISKRIIEMHGGTVSVDSEPGKGATFRVVIPVRVVEQVKEVA